MAFDSWVNVVTQFLSRKLLILTDLKPKISCFMEGLLCHLTLMRLYTVVMDALNKYFLTLMRLKIKF